LIDTHVIHNEAAASLDVTLRVTPDPTSATPQFALSVKGVYTPGSFSNGAWRSGSSWSSTTGQIVATTPTIGGSGTLAITAGVDYWLWYKLTVGSETFVDRCAIVECPA